MPRIGNWYILPVAFAKWMVKADALVPNLLPEIYIVPLTPWLADDGVIEDIVGAVAEPSV